ncbi:alpha-glucan family phosphorylase [Gordonia pseudamarae]|uniref:glycogen phosphorylase n=1 Tax=Gordonia pseudamarae TaxID=2831662 RepID=A0ABX6IIZ0_9ACTN|nr:MULTISPECIES: alpha-glucan family phosphorylase [Gordonia]MBD0021403.1 alpha-glucan family phosphorylase [Gordonia sp. (in: high G+C Gram-positive bacteria)]QHN26429.1 alpha-glucan family phosphorylase [Gordonia pseudamarae]QHN35324.1 alpha-glucan family phosphorylase [Gordonia pseudamarae]
MKAFRRFTVRVPLPESLADLSVLAHNLRWSWHTPTQNVFAAVDPDLWAADRDPLRLLSEVAPERLAALSTDTEFLARLREAAGDLDAYLADPAWFGDYAATLDRDATHAPPAESPTHAPPAGIAYFSMEFGISEVLPIYSGGLGILAGDHLKAASDLGLPLIGVGLFYRSGYFRQSLSHDGWQIERYPVNDPTALPLTLFTDGDGAPVTITIPMPGNRVLSAQVWVATVGRIPLLLLDSDLANNDEEMRAITDRLYGGDQNHRIKQEILLGIGGTRAIREYARLTGRAQPSVFHMNEGHAGFLGVERIRELVTGPEGLDVDSAESVVRASNIFTTHTPVPAGIDRFPVDLVRYYLDPDDEGRSRLLGGLHAGTVLDLGDEADPNVFNMAHMGFRLGQRSNGVSELHGAVSREMFADLWPGFDADEVPIGSVTNGVHGPTWVAPAWQRLTDPDAPSAAVVYRELSADKIWDQRTALRADLVDEVRRRALSSGRDRGFTDAELGWTSDIFDPDALTIGFARRAATYKRLTLMLRDPDRLRAILTDPDRPVQLVIAGKAHPADDGGKSLIQQVVRFTEDPELRDRMIFLPDYDISMARHIYAGCDVWLNNPVRPLEACGTSGMKSALNGGLNLSILDGWWDEMADGENGWAIGSAEGVTDEHRRDDLEAQALYELLEESVIPLFYGRDDDGIPQRWVEMVRHTLAELGPKVLASRMVRDYTTALYAPAAASFGLICADGYAGARDLADYRGQLNQRWGAVQILGVDDSGSDAATADPAAEPGASVTLTAHVELGGLTPERVAVQALVGRVSADGDILDPTVTEMTPAGGPDASGRTLFSAVVSPRHSGRHGYTARVLPKHPNLTDDAELGFVRYPSGTAEDAGPGVTITASGYGATGAAAVTSS